MPSPTSYARLYVHEARYLDERTRMMQVWADYLDGPRVGGKVIAIRFPRACFRGYRGLFQGHAGQSFAD